MFTTSLSTDKKGLYVDSDKMIKFVFGKNVLNIHIYY